MASIAGKVAPVPKGAWDSITAYEKLNIVSHNGYVYMAKSDNTGHEPVSGASDTYWMLLVSGGVVSVDSAMSPTSTNPVQNKVIGTALDTAKDEAQEVVTDQYNSVTNYDVMGNANGYPSFCISGDVLYKCITACVGVAPPNVTYWEATDVGTEISSLNSDISDLASRNLYTITRLDITNSNTITIGIPSTTSFFGEVAMWTYAASTLSSVCYKFDVFYVRGDLYISPISDDFPATISDAQVSNSSLVITLSTTKNLRINAVLYAY